MAWHNYWMLIALSLRLQAGVTLCSGRDHSSGIAWCVTWRPHLFLSSPLPGIDEDEVTAEEPSTAVPDEIPPLEGDEDASRMEEVD